MDNSAFTNNSSPESKPATYAVLRTRFQPYHIGHQWAIEQFLHWSKIDAVKYTFDARKLVLAVVDPALKYRNDKGNARFNPDFNPFDEWQVTRMTQLAVCGDGDRCASEGSRIIRTRMPPMTSLETRSSYSWFLNGFCNRLPPFDDFVWFFPIFDEEDLSDIAKLWSFLPVFNNHGGNNSLQTIPKKIIVTWHPQFKYCLEESVSNRRDRDIGIHLASYAQLINYVIQPNKELIDADTKVLLEELKQPHEFSSRLRKYKIDSMQRTNHDIWSYDGFSYPNNPYKKLKTMFFQQFNGDGSASQKWQDQSVVKFLPDSRDFKIFEILEEVSKRICDKLTERKALYCVDKFIIPESIKDTYMRSIEEYLTAGESLLNEARKLDADKSLKRFKLPNNQSWYSFVSDIISETSQKHGHTDLLNKLTR